MSDSIEEAKASFQRWLTSFNARDMEGMFAEMHFPHRRLSGENEFQVWETAGDYRDTRNENTITALNSQGWERTEATSIEAVQSGPDKVHLAVDYCRVGADGTAYHTFPSLWIFTRIDGCWGVQFRSSFLSAPLERGNVSE